MNKNFLKLMMLFVGMSSISVYGCYVMGPASHHQGFYREFFPQQNMFGLAPRRPEAQILSIVMAESRRTAALEASRLRAEEQRNLDRVLAESRRAEQERQRREMAERRARPQPGVNLMHEEQDLARAIAESLRTEAQERQRREAEQERLRGLATEEQRRLEAERQEQQKLRADLLKAGVNQDEITAQASLLSSFKAKLPSTPKAVRPNKAPMSLADKLREERAAAAEQRMGLSTSSTSERPVVFPYNPLTSNPSAPAALRPHIVAPAAVRPIPSAPARSFNTAAPAAVRPRIVAPVAFGRNPSAPAALRPHIVAPAAAKQQGEGLIYSVYSDRDAMLAGRSIGTYQIQRTLGTDNNCMFYAILGCEGGENLLRVIMGAGWRPRTADDGRISLQDVRLKFFNDILGYLATEEHNNRLQSVRGLLFSTESYMRIHPGADVFDIRNNAEGFLRSIFPEHLDSNFAQIFNIIYLDRPGFRPVCVLNEVNPSPRTNSLTVKNRVSGGNAVFIHHAGAHYSTIRRIADR